MVHRVVRVHLVDQPQLDLIADPEAPVDRMVGGACLPVDKAPMHVRRCRDPVDVDHVIFPFDTARLALRLLAVLFFVLGFVPVCMVALAVTGMTFSGAVALMPAPVPLV